MAKLRGISRVGILLGALLLAGGFYLVFNPTGIGPHTVVLWKLPQGPLGLLAIAAGAALVLRGLKPVHRPRAAGVFLALCGVAFAFGFSFNWFYDW
ncbi:MAG: hypothetical protein IBX68_10425 [Dehalococcoidia bacterium]|nr:hypothetical protein [Dehalococcoidia bacterium]